MIQLLIFIICNFLNVVIQTIKNIVTVKGGKISAALINAAAFSFYTYILILISDGSVSTITKCFIVGFCNLVGVYIVKLLEEKSYKEKLWKIEFTTDCPINVGVALAEAEISYNEIDTATDDKTIVNCFCDTKAEVKKVKTIIEKYNCKYFISETRWTF